MVRTGASGEVSFYDNTGTVDALADVVGYYKSSTITEIQARLVAAEAALTAQAASIQQNADDLLDASTDVDALLSDTNVIPSGVTVNFGGTSSVTSDDDPACLGSFFDPTAPAGKVCLSLFSSSAVDDVNGNVFGGGTERGTFIVKLTTNTAANSDMYAFFTWASTAP